MSTATARAEFGAALTTALPEFVIFPDGNSFHETTKPVLIFERSRVDKFPGAPQGVLRNTFSLIVVAPPNTSEDQLDGWLDDVLDVLTDETETAWDSAERASYLGQFAAYVITLTTNSNRKG